MKRIAARRNVRLQLGKTHGTSPSLQRDPIPTIKASRLHSDSVGAEDSLRFCRGIALRSASADRVPDCFDECTSLLCLSYYLPWRPTWRARQWAQSTALQKAISARFFNREAQYLLRDLPHELTDPISIALSDPFLLNRFDPKTQCEILALRITELPAQLFLVTQLQDFQIERDDLGQVFHIISVPLNVALQL